MKIYEKYMNESKDDKLLRKFKDSQKVISRMKKELLKMMDVNDDIVDELYPQTEKAFNIIESNIISYIGWLEED